MPLPVLFIGVIALSGGTGIGSGVKAFFDHNKSRKLNENTQARLEAAVIGLETNRVQCRDALNSLGEEKISILQNNMSRFIDDFSQLKNVDFRDSIGLEELKKLHIDLKDFEALTDTKNLLASGAIGTIAGIAGGTAAAAGAYGAAGAFGLASTGTQIAALSGAAAKNATLAFFGGGSLASGGLGMAGGTAILGGLIAGPALLVLGTVLGSTAGRNLDDAIGSQEQADIDCAQMENGAAQCIAIRRRAYMFHTVLARLDIAFTHSLREMEAVMEAEGLDYSLYTADSKKRIASAAAAAVAIKTLLDTPILTSEGDGSGQPEGELTEISGTVIGKYLQDKN